MRNSSIRPRDDGRAARRVRALPYARLRERLDDEVAIDFPSLHEALERIRAGFVADASDADGCREFIADVYLSARQAFDGATVPLDVPVRRICRSCGGRGEVWSERCEACEGSGEALGRHPVHVVVPPRVQDGDRFALSVAAPAAPRTRVAVRIVLS